MSQVENGQYTQVKKMIQLYNLLQDELSKEIFECTGDSGFSIAS